MDKFDWSMVILGILIFLTFGFGMTKMIELKQKEDILAMKYCNEKGYFTGDATKVSMSDKWGVYCETLNDKGEIMINDFDYVNLDIYEERRTR